MLEIREQTRLPLGKLLRICRLSIAHRLLRSFVTVAIIALAIAFLASTLTAARLGLAARDEAVRETRDLSAYSRFLTALQAWSGPAAALDWMASAPDDAATAANLREWGGGESAGAFRLQAAEARQVMNWFEILPPGSRVLLAENRSGIELLDWLAEPENRKRFATRLAGMPSAKPPIPAERLNALLDGWPGFRAWLGEMTAGRNRRLEALAQNFAPRKPEQALIEAAASGESERIFADVETNGLAFSPDERRAIAREAVFEAQLAVALAWTREPAIRAGWNAEFQEDFSPARVLESSAGSPQRLRWIKERLGEKSAGFNEKEFSDVGEQFQRRREAFEAGKSLSTRYGTQAGIDTRTGWLIGVSFLVCVVGIANAMLMSVLERFKEIATMKCLGARNETIGFLFIFESLAMGLLGGALGIAGAVLFAVLPGLWIHGDRLLRAFPFGGLAEVAGLGLAAGLILSGVAAIYPAMVASRMAPLEAMRVD
jgi:putative ABC transport system permease protein